MKVTPVLLCGGSGTRLWPLSRRSYPKQFVPLIAGESLFQQAAKRTCGNGFQAPVVVTGEDFRFIVLKQLSDAGIRAGAILVEPSPRNTGPAVLAAALQLAGAEPDAMMLVAPSDHVIPDATAFRTAVARGAPVAESGHIVTFGVTPTRAETGYGWLELAARPNGAPVPLTRFVEKPCRARAEEMFMSGNCLWNAGLFLSRASQLVAAMKEHAPELVAPVCAAVDERKADSGFVRLDARAWEAVSDVSIDRAVMEKARGLHVVPFDAEWSDLGGWDAVGAQMEPDALGVATAGPATAIDCRDTVLRSESGDLEIVGIGLKDVIAVAMPDAVLVADRSRAQDVGLAVSALKSKSARQADTFPRDHRPWGWFETLALSERFQVKRLVLHPGAALSLQSHVHRAEHWVVVSGTARVTVNDTSRLVSENESVYVPLGARHRLENPGKVAMVLIEVQTGAYLGEDDIVRYEDAYERD